VCEPNFLRVQKHQKGTNAMSEIRFDTISHSWLAWDTENDQPLNPQPIIEAFTPHDIYYDARVPFGAIYEATQSDTIHITADFAESLTLTHAAPDVFVAFERNVRAVSVTTEVENGDDVLLVNLQNGALIRLVQSGADAVRFRIGSNSDDRQGYDGTSQTLAGFAASYQTGFGRDSAVFDPNIGQADILFGANGQLKPVLIGLPVSATDPNGDPIVYRLDNVSLALGFDIDAQSGQVRYRGDGSTLVDGDRLTLTITASSHGANGDNSEIQQALTVNVVTGVQTENEIRWYNGGWAVWDIVNDQPLTPQPDELWDVNNLIVITADVTDTLIDDYVAGGNLILV